MNYDRFPETKIHNYHDRTYGTKDDITSFFSSFSVHANYCLTLECYPGMDDSLLELISLLYQPDNIILSDDIFYDGEVLTAKMQPYLTEDRVRGVMYPGELEDFIESSNFEQVKNTLPDTGKTLIYGVGAALINRGDTLIYCDLARWEIQLRFRKGMANWKQENYDEDILRKYKRAFFIEWRIADKRKMAVLETTDYYLDANDTGQPKIISTKDFLAGLRQLARQPFRLVPYFDPGVWGGQWMKEVCGLDKNQDNYAWSFDGVPEENSLLLRYGDTLIETAAINLVLYQPLELLGQKNYERFGAEYPIRFDFLDTMGGQNLSLQVHPFASYIKEKYGMAYTQDESYYILDAKEDAVVYLGLKENVDPGEMEKDLNNAQKGLYSFPDEKYINQFPAHKHDHFLIPAGTIHCSGRNTMVLEISATPYIFTYKLWDWDRLGLDGLPRPIHISDGIKNIDWQRNTAWVKDNLINRFELLTENESFKEERTGLHELEFIETRRFTIKGRSLHDCAGGFNMLNLVEGKAALIESPAAEFRPFEVHYAETFIIPAACKQYTISPLECDQVKLIKAYVRH